MIYVLQAIRIFNLLGIIEEPFHAYRQRVLFTYSTVHYSNPLEIVQYILVSITVDSASNGHKFFVR